MRALLNNAADWLLAEANMGLSCTVYLECTSGMGDLVPDAAAGTTVAIARGCQTPIRVRTRWQRADRRYEWPNILTSRFFAMDAPLPAVGHCPSCGRILHQNGNSWPHSYYNLSNPRDDTIVVTFPSAQFSNGSCGSHLPSRWMAPLVPRTPVAKLEATYAAVLRSVRVLNSTALPQGIEKRAVIHYRRGDKVKQGEDIEKHLARGHSSSGSRNTSTRMQLEKVDEAVVRWLRLAKLPAHLITDDAEWGSQYVQRLRAAGVDTSYNAPGARATGGNNHSSSSAIDDLASMMAAKVVVRASTLSSHFSDLACILSHVPLVAFMSPTAPSTTQQQHHGGDAEDGEQVVLSGGGHGGWYAANGLLNATYLHLDHWLARTSGMAEAMEGGHSSIGTSSAPTAAASTAISTRAASRSNHHPPLTDCEIRENGCVAPTGRRLSASTTPDACKPLEEGCEKIVWAVCARSWHAFDRLANCLLPHYEFLSSEAARAKASITGANRSSTPTTCLAVERGSKTGVGGLVLALEALLGDDLQEYMRVVGIVQSACNLRVLPSHLHAKSVKGTPVWPPLSKMYQILHRDVRRVISATKRPQQQPFSASSAEAEAPHGHGVLILRTGNRMLHNEQAILSRLESAVGIPFKAYRPEASFKDTIRLFAQAAAIVGYHGAGHINAVVATRRVCVLEISTYQIDGGPFDKCPTKRELEQRERQQQQQPQQQKAPAWQNDDIEGGRRRLSVQELQGMKMVLPWRSNRHTVGPWSPKTMRWLTYRLPLASMLRGNSVPCGSAIGGEGMTTENKLKTLKYVPLYDADIDNMATLLRECLDTWGAWSRPPSPPPSAYKYAAVVNHKYDGPVMRRPHAGVVAKGIDHWEHYKRSDP